MLKESALVSVGIPTYNRPEGLKNTLDQILNQTYKNIEVIISDNCSTDPEVEKVAREYEKKDSRVKYFRQSENLGMVSNFQFVLREAKGEFYMWAADDDEWHPRFIQTCLDSMGNADMAMQHNYRTIYRKTNRVVNSKTSSFVETFSYYENILTYFVNVNMSIFYGLFRREKILPVLDDKVMDHLEKLILIRFLLNNKVNTFEECLFTEGIDAEEYEVKPFFKLKSKLFNYRPYLIAVFKEILISHNIGICQKKKVVFLILDRTLGAFIKYEKPYRPFQAYIVEIILKVILFLNNLPNKFYKSSS